MAANRCGVSFQGDGWNVLELHHGGSCSTPGINLIPQLHTFKWLSAVSILPPKTETARQTTPWSPVQGSGMAERDTGHWSSRLFVCRGPSGRQRPPSRGQPAHGEQPGGSRGPRVASVLRKGPAGGPPCPPMLSPSLPGAHVLTRAPPLVLSGPGDVRRLSQGGWGPWLPSHCTPSLNLLPC